MSKELSTPLFFWPEKRRSGVLLHPTALPGETGIGSLGSKARAFVDLLQNCGFTLWQMCPLGPTSYGDSPYQCLSAFAGNTYLIDLEELASLGLLTREDLLGIQTKEDSHIDFGWQWEKRIPLLQSVAENAPKNQSALEELYGSYDDFCQTHRNWLRPYTLFRALKSHFDHQMWIDWPEEWRSYERAQQEKAPNNIAEAETREMWLQYLFFGQWNRLKKYAADRDVLLVGDIPIFVALDSADVWQHPGYFKLDKKLQPKCVAGVPPDYFSDTGQLWGNPMYDWKALASDDYQWWLDRFSLNFTLFDWVRIDHFRGFEAAYEIPASAKDARKGKWVKGPGLDFFESIQRKFPEPRIILEDLGVITPEVDELREKTGLPGMAVLQFAFDSPENAYLPHNLSRTTILYPGSHDNDTTVGWYQGQPERIRDYIRKYLRISGDEISWDFLRAGYASVADVFIVPYQDLLSLGSDARFNTPGTATGNWSWRAHSNGMGQLDMESSAYLKELAFLYNRNQ